MRKLLRKSEALQAVRLGIGVGARESRVHGEGPEGEGREAVQRSSTNAQADQGEYLGVDEIETSHKRSFSREPCAVKAASTVLTGGLGRRAEW